MKVFAIIGIITVSCWGVMMLYIGWRLLYSHMLSRKRRGRKHFKCVIPLSETTAK